MKSERNAAMIMMTAAMIGLVLANSPFGKPLLTALAFKLDSELLGIQITVGHVVSDLFLALFFFVAGLELKYELKIGTLSSPKKAMVPVLAALAGVAVPSLIYAYLNWNSGLAHSLSHRYRIRPWCARNFRKRHANSSKNFSLGPSNFR
jgi:NhaA family Na+:H+ antiporter